jgi:hypothetical protein
MADKQHRGFTSELENRISTLLKAVRIPHLLFSDGFVGGERLKHTHPVIGSRANISYVDSLLKFHKQNGGHMVRMPYVDKRPLDLWRLKKAVESRGGFEKVCRSKKWAEIGRDLGYSGKIMSSLSTSLKNSYQKWLCPYEEYLRLAKPGVYQQLETENGGPLTPSPAPSPMKHSNMPTPSSHRGESPARFSSSALQASVNSERATPVQDAQPPAPTTSGFTAINSGGFTAVNSGFTSVNRQPAADVKSSTPAKPFTSPMTSAKNTPEYRPSGLGPANSLKRQMSVDSFDSTRENGLDKDEDNGSRRSKRLKKGMSWTSIRFSFDASLRDPVTAVFGLPSLQNQYFCSYGDWIHSPFLSVGRRSCGHTTHTGSQPAQLAWKL